MTGGCQTTTLTIFSSWKTIFYVTFRESRKHPGSPSCSSNTHALTHKIPLGSAAHPAALTALAPCVSSPAWFNDVSSSSSYVRWEGMLTTFRAHLRSVAIIWTCDFQSPVCSRKCKFNFWRENREWNVLVLLTTLQIMRVSRTAWGLKLRQDKGKRWTASLVFLLYNYWCPARYLVRASSRLALKHCSKTRHNKNYHPSRIILLRQGSFGLISSDERQSSAHTHPGRFWCSTRTPGSRGSSLSTSTAGTEQRSCVWCQNLFSSSMLQLPKLPLSSLLLKTKGWGRCYWLWQETLKITS